MSQPAQLFRLCFCFALIVSVLNLNLQIWHVETGVVAIEEESGQSSVEESVADYLLALTIYKAESSESGHFQSDRLEHLAQKSFDGHFEIDSPPPESLVL